MSDTASRVLGATLGGAIGVLVYWWLLRSNHHLLAATGAGVALGAGWAARRRSILWGVLVAAISVAFCIAIEWLFLPWADDPSLGYFVTHLADLPRNSKISLGAVALVGFYFGMGRNRGRAPPPE